MKRVKTLETILVLVLALVVFYFIFRNKNPEVARWLLIGSLVIGGIGLFIPWVADKIHWAWMKLAHGMGYVMSRVILTLIFFLVVLPMSIFQKLAKKNAIKLKPQGNTYYTDRSFTYTKESLENVW
jgi:hypothetical protein